MKHRFISFDGSLSDFATPSYSPLPSLTLRQKIKDFLRNIFKFS